LLLVAFLLVNARIASFRLCLLQQFKAMQSTATELLSALITFKFSAKITHTPGIPTPSDFRPDKSGGPKVKITRC